MKIVIYSGQFCPYCEKAKAYFKKRELPFEEISAEKFSANRAEMEKKTGRTTIPQIFINDDHIGGYDDLVVLVKSGKFEEYLK